MDTTDVEPAALFIDDHGEVPRFLLEEPCWWRRGIWGFATATPTFVFSRAAQRAFLAWQQAEGVPS
jgi:hypothetical protein